MNRELKYAQNPQRQKKFWIMVYVFIGFVVFFGLYKLASRIRTHSLPVGQIQLSIPYSKYLNGEVITFTIKNNFNSPIYVANQCPAEPLNVYRQENGKWVRIHDTASLKDCSNESRQVKVPANGSVSGNFAPWHHLFNQPGKYRVVAYVEYYNALPYQDFEVINAPAIQLPSTSTNTSRPSSPAVRERESENEGVVEGQTTQTNTAPKTYTITVNYNGNYNTTNLTINSGDSINFVYSPCCGNEVITVFSPITPTTTLLPSITLDHEFTSRTIVFNTKGSWRLKVKDHSGNTLILTVL